MWKASTLLLSLTFCLGNCQNEDASTSDSITEVTYIYDVSLPYKVQETLGVQIRDNYTSEEFDELFHFIDKYPEILNDGHRLGWMLAELVDLPLPEAASKFRDFVYKQKRGQDKMAVIEYVLLPAIDKLYETADELFENIDDGYWGIRRLAIYNCKTALVSSYTEKLEKYHNESACTRNAVNLNQIEKDIIALKFTGDLIHSAIRHVNMLSIRDWFDLFQRLKGYFPRSVYIFSTIHSEKSTYNVMMDRAAKILGSSKQVDNFFDSLTKPLEKVLYQQ